MLEYAKEIIAILSSIIIALIGGGGLLYYSVNKKLKTIQVSISRRKDKWITDTQTVVLSHHGVLFSNKKEQMTGT